MRTLKLQDKHDSPRSWRSFLSNFQKVARALTRHAYRSGDESSALRRRVCGVVFKRVFVRSLTTVRVVDYSHKWAMINEKNTNVRK